MLLGTVVEDSGARLVVVEGLVVGSVVVDVVTTGATVAGGKVDVIIAGGNEVVKGNGVVCGVGEGDGVVEGRSSKGPNLLEGDNSKFEK